MSKLRWTLLILGGLFIVALGLWERWRPRHARGLGAQRPGSEPGEPQSEERAQGMPRMGDAGGQDESDAGRAEPGKRSGWLPWGGSQAGVAQRDFRARGLSGDEFGTAFPDGIRADPSEPWIGEPELADIASSGSGLRAERPPQSTPNAVVSGEPANIPVVLAAASDPAAAAQPLREARAEDLDESPTAELPVLAAAAAQAPAIPQSLEETAVLEGQGPAAPIVKWPPEASRRIVALRLVAPPERFPGRALRLALAAEGFLLGKFDIFHKPDKAYRAIVSAASLTRPGTFDLDAMDSQRYSGLSLFVVLPGPCPAGRAFEELLDVARNLGERLQGELQDAAGEVLTDESIEWLRDTLPAGGEAAS